MCHYTGQSPVILYIAGSTSQNIILLDKLELV